LREALAENSLYPNARSRVDAEKSAGMYGIGSTDEADLYACYAWKICQEMPGRRRMARVYGGKSRAEEKGLRPDRADHKWRVGEISIGGKKDRAAPIIELTCFNSGINVRIFNKAIFLAQG
jgi:hypothetical protein